MSMATTTDTQSPALHVADSHDLIRVHGARENNLKDVSVEIPKRRLTVLTGVSGSGKSSLVFGTTAAESQRLINETYSAFVQGFVPRCLGIETGLLVAESQRCLDRLRELGPDRLGEFDPTTIPTVQLPATATEHPAPAPTPD